MGAGGVSTSIYESVCLCSHTSFSLLAPQSSFLVHIEGKKAFGIPALSPFHVRAASLCHSEFLRGKSFTFYKLMPLPVCPLEKILWSQQHGDCETGVSAVLPPP